VEVYYECILKLTNCLQHHGNDSLCLLTTFFQACLQLYLWIVIVGMKRDTFFEHKKIVVTCEESMGDANEYQKLLEPPTKQ
jgi:hypothetical protein